MVRVTEGSDGAPRGAILRRRWVSGDTDGGGELLVEARLWVRIGGFGWFLEVR